MKDLQDLFNQRELFATKLSALLESGEYTKAKLCNGAQISRPTLDKILAGKVTNQKSFERHADKILQFLKLTPDVFLANVCNPSIRIKHLQNILHFSEEDIAERTGISLERLKEIENGEDATTAELRDIAFCFKTSVRTVLGTYYFSPPLSQYYMFNTSDEISGFWGHLGVLLNCEKEYKWYPITYAVKRDIYKNMDDDYMVVPCMNNIILLLNMDKVDSIILLDEAADPPGFANWDPEVSEGEIPLVFYEAVLSWLFEEEDNSPQLNSYIEKIVKSRDWDEDDILGMTDQVNVYFSNGNQLSTMADFNSGQNLTSAFSGIYDFGDDGVFDKRIFFDGSEAEVILNLKNVAMIEAPLLQVEDRCCEELKEMLG